MCPFIRCRKVEEGQERGVSLDTSSVTQSSQYHFIQSKPDYHGLLRRQQPMLHTMAMIVCLKYIFFSISKMNHKLILLIVEIILAKFKIYRIFNYYNVLLYTICKVVYAKIQNLAWNKKWSKCFLAVAVMKHKADATDLWAA